MATAVFSGAATAIVSDPAEMAVRLHEDGVIAYRKGLSARAETLFQSALELFEITGGPNSMGVAAVLNDLGTLVENRYDYKTAMEHYGRATDIMTVLRGNTGADLQRLCLLSWSNLGRLYRIQGRFEQARRFFKQALCYAELKFGVKSLPVAKALNDLGLLGKFAGWFDEAEKYYRRALSIVQENFKHERDLLASLYHNLGGLAHARGEFVKGEPYARKSVALRARVSGADHPDVAADIAALARLLEGQGKYEEAEKLYRHALKLFRQVYGELHHEIVHNLNNLAALCRAQGRVAESEEFSLKAQAIQEKIFDGKRRNRTGAGQSGWTFSGSGARG
jgi:tetratricopeptide (TPR) repeat protein